MRALWGAHFGQPLSDDFLSVDNVHTLGQVIGACGGHAAAGEGEDAGGGVVGDGGGMADPYFVLKDLPQYVVAQKKIASDYTDKDKWLHKAIMNTACSGCFSSDRTITEYNNYIWHLKPLEL